MTKLEPTTCGKQERLRKAKLPPSLQDITCQMAILLSDQLLIEALRHDVFQHGDELSGANISLTWLDIQSMTMVLIPSRY